MRDGAETRPCVLTGVVGTLRCHLLPRRLYPEYVKWLSILGFGEPKSVSWYRNVRCRLNS